MQLLNYEVACGNIFVFDGLVESFFLFIYKFLPDLVVLHLNNGLCYVNVYLANIWITIADLC